MNFNTWVSTLLLFVLVDTTMGRGKRIDIFSQSGGDMNQIRSVAKTKGVMYNALPRNSALKWSKNVDGDGNFVIPYVITGIYDSSERAIIADAMRRLEENTCIRLRKRENERDYVEIQNQQNEGCYTNVGRVNGRNVVMLEANEQSTCVEPDIVIHELMHSIGLWHEHMRYDRDQFITVLYDNIEAGFQSQFEKISPQESTTYGIPYDYRSVMHYAETAFARRGQRSMITKDQRFQKIIGTVRDASASDYAKICIMYGCGRCMGKQFDAQSFSGASVDTRDPSPSETRQGPFPDIVGPQESGLPAIFQASCKDVYPKFCGSLVKRGFLDCNFLGADYCCGTCAATVSKKSTNITTIAIKLSNKTTVPEKSMGDNKNADNVTSKKEQSVWQRIASIFS